MKKGPLKKSAKKKSVDSCSQTCQVVTAGPSLWCGSALSGVHPESRMDETPVVRTTFKTLVDRLDKADLNRSGGGCLQSYDIAAITVQLA